MEILLNTVLVAELIEKGDLAAVKEAMEKSLAEGSQSFEADIARLITEGVVSRDEGMAYADSPTNLIWRLHNDMTPVSKAAAVKEEHDGATFTDITLDVVPAESRAMPLGTR
jgi:twitching motility protein PilU